MVIITGVLCAVAPLSVALTKRPTVPRVLPAVNVTEAPVVELSVPIAPFVRVHEYETPEGQGDVQVGVAVNGGVVAFVETVNEVGSTLTETTVFTVLLDMMETVPWP
jgi:hypothetical protein